MSDWQCVQFICVKDSVIHFKSVQTPVNLNMFQMLSKTFKG